MASAVKQLAKLNLVEIGRRYNLSHVLIIPDLHLPVAHPRALELGLGE